MAANFVVAMQNLPRNYLVRCDCLFTTNCQFYQKILRKKTFHFVDYRQIINFIKLFYLHLFTCHSIFILFLKYTVFHTSVLKSKVAWEKSKVRTQSALQLLFLREIVRFSRIFFVFSGIFFLSFFFKLSLWYFPFYIAMNFVFPFSIVTFSRSLKKNITKHFKCVILYFQNFQKQIKQKSKF